MRYREISPEAPQLRAAIECFWFLEDGPAGSPRDAERIVPDGCTELILHLGDAFERLTARGPERQARALLAGQMPRFILLRPPRTIDTVGVRFRPAGARRFFRGPASDATGRFVALEDLWDRGASERIQDRLHHAKSTEERARALERALLEALHGDEDGLAGDCAAFILGRAGHTSVAGLARRAGLSERSLQRRFRAAVGLTPKAFARVARLQGVLKRIGRGQPPDWADVAVQSSYFDQPHLIHDFRELTGETPAEFLRNQGRLSLNFTDPRRLAALLGG